MLRMSTDTLLSNLTLSYFETRYFLGVDIGKDTFHAALTSDGQIFEDQEVKNSPAAIKQYFQSLQVTHGVKTQQLMVCMEHTGIYCYPLLDYLTKHSVKVCVESAVQIKQSPGMQRGKNDKVDAKRIARYLCKNFSDLKLWAPKREIIQKLKALLVVRDRLIKAKNQF